MLESLVQLVVYISSPEVANKEKVEEEEEEEW